MKVYSFFPIFFLIIYWHYTQAGRYSDTPVVPINYNLSNPDKIYVLPNALREVSGITETDSISVACIQDEVGILFIYDLKKEEIKRQSSFSFNGDYEGIARAGKTIFILRSDGMLFEILNYESAYSDMKSYITGVPSKDIEGLCFDQKQNRLLIAPKSDNMKGKENKGRRFIYSFDLKSKKLAQKPAFVFDLKVIKKFASDNKIKVPMKSSGKGGKKEPDIEFRPSEIGINPLTNKLFVLSGMERLLFVFNMSGKIEYIQKLDPELFVQPEGITFLKNGDMLISNDIKNKKPTILRFNYLR